ncbi:MAG: hypothetical protein ABIQ73_17690 [Acidimicrobiales bacterium]
MHSTTCVKCGASLGRAFIDLTPTRQRSAISTPRPTVIASNGRRGMAPLLVLLVALAVVAGVLAVVLGGGDDSMSSTPAAPSSTAPPASNVPTTEVQRQPGAVYFENTPGPLFKRPAQGALYLADGSRVKRIDLATGEIAKSAAISLEKTAEATQVVVVEGGIFVVYKSGEVVAFDHDFGKAPLNVGAGGFVVDTGAANKVWIARDYTCDDCATVEWYEADLKGTTGASIELARTTFPVAAIERGLIWQTPSGIFIGRSRSTAKRYATGTLVGARGDTVVWFGCDDITGIDCRYNVGDGRDASKRQLELVNTLSRPSASYLERLGAFPLSRDSIALPRSNDARLPLLNVETGQVSILSTGSTFFRALSMYWTADSEWLVIHASKTIVRAVNARTGGVAEITLPIESTGDIAVGAR